MNKVISFLRETKTELSKVSWPTSSQVFNYTLIVIGLALFMAIYLGLLDAAFNYLIQTFIVNRSI